MANATNQLLWWCLVVSLLIYVVVAYVAQVPASPEVPLGTVAAVLTVIAVGTAVGTILYRRRALVGPIRRGELDPSRPADLQRAFTPFILNLVLSESVGIYGLVLAILSGKPAWCLPFVASALGLMFVHRPTAPDLAPSPGGVGARPPPIG